MKKVKNKNNEEEKKRYPNGLVVEVLEFSVILRRFDLTMFCMLILLIWKPVKYVTKLWLTSLPSFNMVYQGERSYLALVFSPFVGLFFM